MGESKIESWIVVGLLVVTVILLGVLIGFVAHLPAELRISGPSFELKEWEAEPDADGNIMFTVQVENINHVGQLVIKCEVQTAIGNHETVTHYIDLQAGQTQSYDVLVDMPATDSSSITGMWCTVVES